MLYSVMRFNLHGTVEFNDFFQISYGLPTNSRFILNCFLSVVGNDLSMDRTNWRWGKSDINILILGIVFKGTAIPIYWMLLDKRGNSDTPKEDIDPDVY